MIWSKRGRGRRISCSWDSTPKNSKTRLYIHLDISWHFLSLHHITLTMLELTTTTMLPRLYSHELPQRSHLIAHLAFDSIHLNETSSFILALRLKFEHLRFHTKGAKGDIVWHGGCIDYIMVHKYPKWEESSLVYHHNYRILACCIWTSRLHTYLWLFL